MDNSLLKKRERTQNWALEEKQLLLRLCERNIKYIENKKADSQTSNLKNVAWQNIHKEFVSTFGSDRDCNRLKEQWRRMKGWARSEILEQRGKEWKRPSALSEHVWRVMELSHRYQKEDLHQVSSEDDESRLLKINETDQANLDCTEEPNNTSNGIRPSAGKWASGDLDHTSLCEVQIKEEPSGEDVSNYMYNSYTLSNNSVTIERCHDLKNNSQNQTLNGNKRISLLNNIEKDEHAADLSANSNNQEFVSTTTRLSRKRTRNNSFACDNDGLVESVNNSDEEYQQFKLKELVKKSLILDEELQTARLNRETAEINKRIAEEKLKQILKQNGDLNTE